MCQGHTSNSAYLGSASSEPAHSSCSVSVYSCDSRSIYFALCFSQLPSLITALQHLLDSCPQLPFLHELSESSLSPHFLIFPQVRRHWGHSFSWLFPHLIPYTHKILRQEEILAQFIHMTDKETEVWRPVQDQTAS